MLLTTSFPWLLSRAVAAYDRRRQWADMHQYCRFRWQSGSGVSPARGDFKRARGVPGARGRGRYRTKRKGPV